MADQEQRRKLVWEIDKRLQEDGARPIVFHARGATCMQPYVKGVTIMVNSIYNGWRFEHAVTKRYVCRSASFAAIRGEDVPRIYGLESVG